MRKESIMAQSNKKAAEQQRLAEKRKQQNKLIILTIAIGVALILLAVGLIYGLGPKDKIMPIEGFSPSEEVTNYVRLNITYTDKQGKQHTGDVIVELDPEAAPITVENFQNLVKSDFYDGLTFHRIIKGFMIQGGDPEGTGMGGSSNTIKGEFKANGVENPISHTRGVISMARNGYSYNSASSQFFIMHQTNTDLDGEYAAFGRVVYGMETVDGVANVSTSSSNNKPRNTVKLNYAIFVTKD